MEAQRAKSNLRLRDPRDFIVGANQDIGRVVAELADAGAKPQNGLWRAPFWPDHRDPATYDHLVVAEDKGDGHALAVLGADVLRTAEEEFLFISTAFVAPLARGRRVLRGMVVTALMQAARTGQVPRVIAARSQNPVFYRALRRLARDFGVPLYPDLPSGPISLRGAALARRIARRVSPQCRFEPGSGAIRGALRAHGMIGAVQPAAAGIPGIDAGYADRLGPDDQLLLVLDLRGLERWTITEIARRIRRRK
jgi:GNAT superfamily N-acetyltransferase